LNLIRGPRVPLYVGIADGALSFSVFRASEECKWSAKKRGGQRTHDSRSMSPRFPSPLSLKAPPRSNRRLVLALGERPQLRRLANSKPPFFPPRSNRDILGVSSLPPVTEIRGGERNPPRVFPRKSHELSPKRSPNLLSTFSPRPGKTLTYSRLKFGKLRFGYW